MSAAQLRLVNTADAPLPSMGTSTDPARQVFEHWLFMARKSPARCKLGPTRRAAINAALTLYDAQTLMLAIDGAATDPWINGVNRLELNLFDPEWLFAKEQRIERALEMGDQLHAQAEAARARAAEQAAAPAESPEAAAEAAAARERMRDMALYLRSRARHG